MRGKRALLKRKRYRHRNRRTKCFVHHELLFKNYENYEDECAGATKEVDSEMDSVICSVFVKCSFV